VKDSKSAPTPGDSVPGEQTIGYARPPASTRWKKGQSGNPRGRRKAAKTVGRMIEETMMRKLTIDEDGRSVTLTLQEIILRNLGYAAARRDMNAIKTLFSLKERYQDSKETQLDPAELDPNDRAIIEGYLETLQGASLASDSNVPTEKIGDGGEAQSGDFKPDLKSPRRGSP
jgi:hypothetical protein